MIICTKESCQLWKNYQQKYIDEKIKDRKKFNDRICKHIEYIHTYKEDRQSHWLPFSSARSYFIRHEGASTRKYSYIWPIIQKGKRDLPNKFFFLSKFIKYSTEQYIIVQLVTQITVPCCTVQNSTGQCGGHTQNPIRDPLGRPVAKAKYSTS